MNEQDEITSPGLGLAMLLVAVLCFTVGNLLTKMATASGLPGGEIAFVRLALFTLYCLYPSNFRLMKFRHKGLLLIRGIAGGLSIAFIYVALAHLGVSVAKLLLLMLPVFAAIIARIVWKKIPTPLTILGLVFTIIGVGIIVVVTTPGDNGWRIDPWHGFALASAFFGAISFACIEAIQKKCSERERKEVNADILGALSFIGVLTVFPFIFFEDWVLPTWSMGWLYLAMLSVASLVGQVLMIRHMKTVGCVTFSIIFQLSPVFTVILAWGLLGEVLSSLVCLGAALAFVGVFLATTKRKAKEQAMTVNSEELKHECQHELSCIDYRDVYCGPQPIYFCNKCGEVIIWDAKVLLVFGFIALAVIAFLIMFVY